MPLLAVNTNVPFVKCIYISLRNASKTVNSAIVSHRIQTLSEHLNCATGTARIIVSKNKSICTIEDEHFNKTLEMCKNNFKLSEIIEYPALISMPPNLLNLRLNVLREIGCIRVPASCIVQFYQFVKETPQNLQHCGILPQDQKEQLELTLKNASCSEDIISEIMSSVEKLIKYAKSLSEIKAVVNGHYLAWKLSMDFMSIAERQNVFRMLALNSIKDLELAISILTDRFGFDKLDIQNNLSVLALSPGNLQNILQELPEILNVSIGELSRLQPKVLFRDVSTLKKVKDILEEFRVTDRQLVHCTKVLTFLPDTLRKRLQFLYSSNDFAALRKHQSFLSLVCYFNNIESRLTVLKQMNVCHSINLFTLSNSNFKKRIYVNKGEALYNNVCHYLSDLLGCNLKEVKQNLKQYPSTLKSSISNVYKVVEYLLNHGVSKEQLWNGLGIVLYDYEAVREHFEEMPYCDNLQPFSEWLRHYNFVQLLIYDIEKNVDFMEGHNIWKHSQIVEMPSDDLNFDVQNDYMCENEDEELLLCAWDM